MVENTVKQGIVLVFPAEFVKAVILKEEKNDHKKGLV